MCRFVLIPGPTIVRTIYLSIPYHSCINSGCAKSIILPSNPWMFLINLSLDTIFSIFFRPLFVSLRPQWLGNTNHLPPCLATTKCLRLSPSSSCLSPWPSQSHTNTIPVGRGVSPLPLFSYEWRSTPPHWQDPPVHFPVTTLFNPRTPELIWSHGNLTLKGIPTWPNQRNSLKSNRGFGSTSQTCADTCSATRGLRMNLVITFHFAIHDVCHRFKTLFGILTEMCPVISNRERTPVTDIELLSSHVFSPCSQTIPNQWTQCHQWNDRLPHVIMRPRMVRDPGNRFTESPSLIAFAVKTRSPAVSDETNESWNSQHESSNSVTIKCPVRLSRKTLPRKSPILLFRPDRASNTYLPLRRVIWQFQRCQIAALLLVQNRPRQLVSSTDDPLDGRVSRRVVPSILCPVHHGGKSSHFQESSRSDIFHCISGSRFPDSAVAFNNPILPRSFRCSEIFSDTMGFHKLTEFTLELTSHVGDQVTHRTCPTYPNHLKHRQDIIRPFGWHWNFQELKHLIVWVRKHK